MRRSSAGLLALILGVAALTYAIGLYAGSRAAVVRSLVTQIAEDQRAIQMLEAELAYLSRPARLQSLSSAYLVLRPPAPEQIVPDLAVLPSIDSAAQASAPALQARGHGHDGREAPL